jgi:hypothetical protein
LVKKDKSMTEQQIMKNEQVILDAKGRPEYVVIPIDRYRKLLEMLEDFGLGQAILEAELSPRLSGAEALAFLDSEDEPEDSGILAPVSFQDFVEA